MAFLHHYILVIMKLNYVCDLLIIKQVFKSKKKPRQSHLISINSTASLPKPSFGPLKFLFIYLNYVYWQNGAINVWSIKSVSNLKTER